MKFKKCLKALAVAAIVLFSSFGMTACGEDDREVVDMTVTGINYIIGLDELDGQQPSYADVNATLKYSDDTTEAAKKTDLTFSNLDLARLGEQELTITHTPTGFAKKITITLTETVANAFLLSLDSELITNFNDVANSEFINKSATLKAGDDNAFKLQLKGEALKNANDPTQGKLTITNCNVTVDVKVKNGSNYEDGSNLVTITGNEIDFKDEAVGKTFKITVTAKNVADGYENNVRPLEYNVDVVDGYNVYTAKDLAVVNNVDTDNGWKEFKIANGYATNENDNYQPIDTNSIVLQKDINITDADIPSAFFYSHEEAAGVGSHPGLRTYKTDSGVGPSVEGSMKDNKTVYNRTLKSADDAEFGIHGNYFQIKFDTLSRITIENGNASNGYIVVNDEDRDKEQMITTHTTLFRFEADTKEISNASDTFVENLDFNGNAPRTARAEQSGGIMLFKLQNVDCEVNNTIYRDSFIGFLLDDGGTSWSQDADVTAKYLLKDVIGRNCYSTLLYVYGVDNATIQGGEFVGAGGPVMIVDHVDGATNGNGGNPSRVDVIGSKMESFVTGNEPWFVSYGATALVGQIAASNKYFTDAGSTYLTSHRDETTGTTVNNMFNLKVVYKSASAEGITSYVVRGGVNFYDDMDQYLNHKDSVNGLDMDTNSALAVANKDNILINSKGDGLNATPYFVYSVPGVGELVFKLAQVEEVLTAYTLMNEMGKLLASGAETQLAGVNLFNNTINQTTDIDYVTAMYQAAQLKLMSMVAGQKSGSTVVMKNMTTAPVAALAGNQTTSAWTQQSGSVTINIPNTEGTAVAATYSLVGTYLMSGTDVMGTVDGDNATFVSASTTYTYDTGDADVDNDSTIKNADGTEFVSNVTPMTQGDFTVDTFTITTMEDDFATVAPTGETNVNYYLFNGMGIVIQLFPLED